MRTPLVLLVFSLLVTAGCSHSRRNVKRAPGLREVFDSKLPEETRVLQPEQQDASSACAPWEGARWCTALMEGWTFVPEAVELCAAETDEDDAIDCLSHAADRTFSLVGLETCGALETAKDRRDCLHVISDRELEAPQFAYCASKKSSRTPGCLQGMHDYVFHPNELHEVIRRSVDEAKNEGARGRIATLENNIATQYELDRSTWPDNYVFNFAGGATTHIRAMYCALDEYLLIVGAPINVNGYSGRYPAEVHDFVFTGIMHDFEETDFESHDYTAGTWAYLPHGGHRNYATETPTYMLEYARGSVPGMLGFGIRHPRRAITQDRKNMTQQIRMCASRALKANGERRRHRRARSKAKRQTLRDVRAALRGV